MSTAEPTLGLDLGGTKILAALVDGDGRILERDERPTPDEEGPDAVIEAMAAAAEAVRGRAGRVAGVGVGAAGQIERGTGVVRFSPNLDWHDVPLGARLSERLEQDVAVSSDVRAAALGEWVHGAGRGCDDLVCVFVGTGVGGGIVSGGRLVHGAANSAGEIGHCPVVPQGPLCRCGGRGCLEAVAGGWALAERARRAARGHPEAGRRLRELAGGAVEDITARTVGRAHAEGDVLAGGLVAEAEEALLAGLVLLTNLLGPERILLGGSVLEGLPGFVGRAEAAVRARALPAAAGTLSVRPAALGDDAVAVGAGVLARGGVD